MTLVRLIARPMMAATFVTGGINALKNADVLAERAAPVTDRLAPTIERATASLPIQVDSKRLVQAGAVLDIVAGSMLATGRMPRLASLALAATLVPSTLGTHRYWDESDPRLKSDHRSHFFKNVSMMGALLLAGVDTEGRPSLTWRAKRQARHAKESVTSLASH